jgi:arylsulfatase A-like enzyme
MLTRRQAIELTGAAFATAPNKPNVLVILCDQLNPAVISAYGGPVTTPNLDRLAKRGVLFRNATCPTPFCSPTRASLVTGLYPHTHGIVHNVSAIDYPTTPAPKTEQGLLHSDITVDQILNRNGYSTHQYGKWHLSGDALPYYPDQYGEHREYAREMAAAFAEIRRRPKSEWMDWYGWTLPVSVDPNYAASFPDEDPIRKHQFSDFITKIGKLGLKHDDVFDVRVANRTIQRIREAKSPFSITCSFNFPHDPNVIHSPYYDEIDPRKIELPASIYQREPRFEKDLSRQMVATHTETRLREFLRVYYASTRFIDEQAGRVLDALDASGQGPNTIIVFASDHGDMAGGHGMAWKSTQAFYDEIARVPLIVSWPAAIRPGKTDAAASLVDLAPTLLELTSSQVPRHMEGVSLAPILRGGSVAREQFMYRHSERVRPNSGRTRAIAKDNPGEWMIRGAGWKYAIYANGDEFLYNLSKDPGEMRNLAADRTTNATKQQLRTKLAAWLTETDYKGLRVTKIKTTASIRAA